MINYSIQPPPPRERRRSDRFPIERYVSYRILDDAPGESGSGRTINISSSGIWFSSDQMLLPGRRVELSISWPAQLDGPVKLVARGRVARIEGGCAALEIQHYEFRTLPASTLVN